MSSYFPILIAHDPAAVLPPKPLPVDDLQGRLCSCFLEYRGVDYAAVSGLCSKHMPVLGFERERESEKRQMKKKKRSLISPVGSPCILSFQIASATFWPPPGSSRPSNCIACLLSP